MDIYFTQATHSNNIYKLSDFYSGTNYIQNANKKLSVNLTASDGITTVVCPTDTLPDETDVRDYTHIMVPDLTKIYEITSFQYINDSQVQLNLIEDAVIGNYQTLKTKKIMLNRSNDPDLFIGQNDVKDLAIEHTAIATSDDMPENSTGLWMLFTFQGDITGDIEFTFDELCVNNTCPTVGEFATLAALTAAYPAVATTKPYQYDYYLKFAMIGSDTYQCVYIQSDGNDWIDWVLVNRQPVFTIDGTPVTVYRATKKRTMATTGDVDTINVALPLDATLVTSVTFNNGNFTARVPSYWHYVSNNEPGKLLSMRIIPDALLGIMTGTKVYTKHVATVAASGSGPYYGECTGETTDFYDSKNVEFSNLAPGADIMSFGTYKFSLSVVKKFETLFSFGLSGVSSATDYEPFKHYYLSFYGALVSIPARYVNDFNVRLAVTSTSILYEVYTDKYNIIGSGDLTWFVRFTVDSLALYQASNPTYKEQFWTSQITGAIRSSAGGAMGGLIAGGPTGAAIGASTGAANALLGTVAGHMNLQLMEKGLKDKADQIQGINDVALALVKGFDAYIITISAETDANTQMKTALELLGFPALASTTIDSLTAHNVDTIGLGASKLVVGRLLETVRNASVTRMIDNKLQEGVIII